MISVVCPFYNERDIIEASVRLMLQNLSSLKDEWELIVVNDGSTDDSPDLVGALAADDPRLRVIGYAKNRGRGYAIRQGVRAARGDIVVTTEVDSSWGDDIVPRIIEAFEANPDADIIIASPHREGGGYRNVPWHRVFLSSAGNFIIRSGLNLDISMNTGMTRGYRRDKFLALPLYEDEKEQHLEIINKSLAFNYHIYEIPAILEWKDHRLTKAPGKKRVSSSKINKLIRTHLMFSLLAAPFRYIYVLAAVLALVSSGMMAGAVINLFRPAPSIYLALTSFLLMLFALVTVAMGVLGQQNRAIQQDLWRLQSEFAKQATENESDGKKDGQP